MIVGRSRRRLIVGASTTMLSQYMLHYDSFGVLSYLLLMKHRSKAVEELKRCQDLTLNKHSCHHCCSRPPSCAGWHFEPPLLDW